MFVQVPETSYRIFGDIVPWLGVNRLVQRMVRPAGRVAEPFGVWPGTAGLLAEPLLFPIFSFTLALVQTCLCYPLFRSDMYTYPMLFISMLYSQMEMTRRMPVLSSRRGRLISSLPSLLAPVAEPRTRAFSVKQVAAVLGGTSPLQTRRPQR